MQKFYSQHGEDFILNEIFKDQNEGFFVEVGCIDGRRFSNTLTFEEKGWKGICIEAHSDYIELLKKNRPGSIIEHCAVGEKDEDSITFYANSRGSLSTLDKTREKLFNIKFGKYFTGFEEQQVVQLTLNTIFEKNAISKIDFISIDIEGYEVEALKGFDLALYKPKVLVIESDSNEHEDKLDSIILANEYEKRLKIKQNIFYIRSDIKNKTLLNGINRFKLITTQHPLDESGDEITEMQLVYNDDNINVDVRKLNIDAEKN
jgi:FkbM family methyltransferase